jgi:hypothetical protein
VLLIASSVNESDRPFFGVLLYQLELIGVIFELDVIAFAETPPLFWVVSEPFPKLGAGRNVFEP